MNTLTVPKVVKPKTLAEIAAPTDPIAVIREELADYEKQRTEAVQNSNFWQQKVLLADGAYQACAALLKKLDEDVVDKPPS
jgi:hypothetical protein